MAMLMTWILLHDAAWLSLFVSWWLLKGVNTHKWPLELGVSYFQTNPYWVESGTLW